MLYHWGITCLSSILNGVNLNGGKMKNGLYKIGFVFTLASILEYIMFILLSTHFVKIFFQL
jgi:uncharacterized membrane protein YhdT